MRATVRGCAPMRDDADGGTDVAKRDGGTTSTIKGRPLSRAELGSIDAWWRAANYLSVGQIYLMDNPLLREPLLPEHVKPRLLGHWGTTPGLNFVYAHLNRTIIARDLDMMYVIGPGHGGPGLVASAWLEGTYSEVYPDIEHRCRRHAQAVHGSSPSPAASRATSRPRHPARSTRVGSSGYSLSHAYGAAFDNPDLVVAAIVGDGEAETGPLATSWHSTKFVDPRRDGAVLPILHLNGYKIANPTVLARISGDELESLLRGYGHAPYVVEGSDPAEMHQAFAATLDRCLDEIREIQDEARTSKKQPVARRPWPMIVLRSPKGWTGPKEVDGTARGGLLAIAPGPVRQRAWRRLAPCRARGVDAQLPPRGALRRERRSRRPGRRPASGGGTTDERQPARQWRGPAPRPQDARLPRLRRRRGPPRHRRGRSDQGHGGLPAGRDGAQHGQLPDVLPGREQLQPSPGRAGGHRPRLERRDPAIRRPPGRRRAGDGDPLRAHL